MSDISERYRTATAAASFAAGETAVAATEYAVASAIVALEVVRSATQTGDWLTAMDSITRVEQAAHRAGELATWAAKTLDDADR